MNDRRRKTGVVAGAPTYLAICPLADSKTNYREQP